MIVECRLRDVDYSISGDTAQEIVEKANSVIDGMTISIEDVLKQGLWSVVYRHDYAKKHPRTKKGKEIPREQL